MNKFTFTILLLSCFLFLSGNVNAQDIFDLSGSDNVDILKDTLDDIPDGSTLLLGPGKTYNLGGDSIVIGKSLTFDSSDPAAAEKPHLYCNKNYDIIEDSDIAHLVFKNLRITGEYGSTYIFNITDSGTIGEFTVENCDIYNIRGLLRAKGGVGVLNKYNMINCTVDSVRNYGILAIDKSSWMCNDIVVKNSTFKNMEYFLISRNNSNSVLVENCTFDAMPEGGRPWFRWRESGQDNVMNGITVRNVIYSHAWDVNDGGIITDGFDGLGDTEWTIENCYTTNEYSNVGEDTIVGFPNFTYAGTADDLWADRANFDYSFKDETFAGIGNAGDPRWIPQGDVYDLSNIDNVDILKDTLDDVPDGALILLGPGKTYNLGGDSIVIGKSLTFDSSDPNADVKPHLFCNKNFDIIEGSDIAYMVFKNLRITGEYSSTYIYNITESGSIGEFTVENCDFYNLRGLIRIKGGEGTLDKYNMINCTVDSIRNYGVLAIDKSSWQCNDIVVKNSTIKNMEYFLISRNNSNSVLVENCTFDAMPEGGRPWFRWRESGQDNVLNGITIKNVIYSHAWDVNDGGIITDCFDGLGETNWTIENCYATNEFSTEGEDAIEGFPNFAFEGTADDLWTDRANFDYTFKDLSFAGNNNAGDPRWWEDYVNSEDLTLDNELEIYPNPSNGHVFVSVSKPSTVAIYNFAGNVMLQEKVVSAIGRIDISELPAGMYIVKTMDGNATAKKLIVQ